MWRSSKSKKEGNATKIVNPSNQNQKKQKSYSDRSQEKAFGWLSEKQNKLFMVLPAVSRSSCSQSGGFASLACEYGAGQPSFKAFLLASAASLSLLTASTWQRLVSASCFRSAFCHCLGYQFLQDANLRTGVNAGIFGEFSVSAFFVTLRPCRPTVAKARPNSWLH